MYVRPSSLTEPAGRACQAPEPDVHKAGPPRFEAAPRIVHGGTSLSFERRAWQQSEHAIRRPAVRVPRLRACHPDYLTAPSTTLFLSSFSKSVTSVSVVNSSPAMLAAFCKAVRTTFNGSIMPALNMSTYLPA